jgi:hypothetical protein
MKKNTLITGSFTMYHYSFPKITLLFAFWGLFLFTSCSRPFQQNQKYNYGDLKKIVLKGGYDRLSTDQQAFIKEELIEKLKNDSNYVKYNELHDDFKLAALNSTPVAGQTTSSQIKPHVHTDAERLAFFQEKGFKDPKGTVILMRKMNIEEHAFYQKYPELLFINDEATLEVYGAAKKHRTLKYTPNPPSKN